jgi:hypothetical protein
VKTHLCQNVKKIRETVQMVMTKVMEILPIMTMEMKVMRAQMKVITGVKTKMEMVVMMKEMMVMATIIVAMVLWTSVLMGLWTSRFNPQIDVDEMMVETDFLDETLVTKVNGAEDNDEI